MKQFLEKILNLGVTQKLTSTDFKQTRLLNSFCLTWGSLIPLFIIADFFFSSDVWGSVRIHLIASFVLMCVLFLQSKKKYLAAKIFFITSLMILISALTNSIQIGKNVEVVYYLVPLISLILINNKWINLTYLILSFLLFYIPNLIWNYYDTVFHNPIIIVCVFIGSYVILNYSQTLNKRSEKKLAEAYKELEVKKQGELAHLQLKSLKAQMNPHFMFNAMNSIQNLVLKNDKQEAYNYLTKFASLIRENLNMSEKSFVYFDEELSLLKKYLELEKLRFKESFVYKLIGDDNIEDIKIPSMIIQPFIENAIKHGLLHKQEGIKNLDIEFFQEKNILKCIITDNGIGIKESTEINKKNNNKHTSFSTGAIKERLQILKDYYKSDIGFQYQEVEKGTKVIVKIPFTTK